MIKQWAFVDLSERGAALLMNNYFVSVVCSSGCISISLEGSYKWNNKKNGAQWKGYAV